jgi:DNA polymerase-3 subunit delta'
MARKPAAAAPIDPLDRAALLAEAQVPWLAQQRAQLAAARREGRMPHALLLHGAAGAGQSGLALWTAQLVLCEAAGEGPCGRCPSCILFLAGNHPDFYSIELEEKASYIKVDQIREVCGKLAMRSFRGAGKVGIIDPADRMNIQSNNALLKTLEEPSEETLLILSASRLDRLPRTVISRCQRLKVSTPDEAQGMDWLNAQQPRDDWQELLALSAGAPLRALQMATDGTGELCEEMRRGLFEAIATNQYDPLGMAAAWCTDRTAERLAWLERWVEELIRRQVAEGDPVNNNRDSRLPRGEAGVNIRAAFAMLDRIREARALLEGSANTQLLIEDLMVQFVETLAGRTAGRMEQQG